jgi:hypothetical protein
MFLAGMLALSTISATKEQRRLELIGGVRSAHGAPPEHRPIEIRKFRYIAI